MSDVLPKKITFERFLSGKPTREYQYQKEPYPEQVKRAAELLQNADAVLIGAGSGMSLAAGAQYAGESYRRAFQEFLERYGEDNPYLQDTYSAGFYAYPDEESFWGMWSKLALYGGADLDITPLHRVVLQMVREKPHFVLTTNVDNQFLKAGFPRERIFATQGSYDRIQCRRGCHQKTYDAVELFRKMSAVRCHGSIPTELVPKCPVCGGPMAMNLRSDDTFVQDDAWYEAEARFSAFLTEYVPKKLVLLELGVGFNTPSIIRYPFERLSLSFDTISLIRLNNGQAYVPSRLGKRAVGINSDMAKSITAIAEEIRLG